jgi:glycosidase
MFKQRSLPLFSLIVLFIAILLPVVFMAGPSLAAPSSVTLVGSLQDELGCPGDWQADCAATHLAEAGNDVWRAEFTVPAGSWEYKMALNDKWDFSYPGSNKALTLDAETAVRFYFDDKTKAVIDNVNDQVAVAAGSFQDQLGCPGVWQPDCVNTLLTDVDGDGIYHFTTNAIPVGGYEFKVALDEGWEFSFPGSNVPFTVTADGDIVTIIYDSATNDVNVTVESGSGLEPGDEDLVSPPVRIDASNEIFYFVLPDRFDNGDPGNDEGGDSSGDSLVNGFLPTDKGFYHGGDIAGLMGKLDYLDGLGVSAIWMTPQFTNSWVQGDGTIAGSSAGYHGYWQIDYGQIDPHFGTNQEMIDFINAAHARGIKVFFDVVINHTGDVITYQEGVFTYRNKEEYPYRDADGNEFDDRDYAGTDTFPPLDPAVSFPYTPIFATPEDATAKNPAWLNNSIYYHNRGDSTFAGESSLYGDFFGLDDLFTEHHVVVDGMIDIHKNMITEFGIDGFRVDTVKHVNDELWEQFVPAILAHAEAQGNPDFFVFGEVFSGDPVFTSRYTTQLPFPSLLDFGFDGAVKAFASAGLDTDGLRDIFANDDYFTDADSNAYGLVKFIGNHDIGRLGYDIDVTNPGAADAERVARSELAHALMFFSRGVPLIYYGDEQGFTGDGGDKDARQDMMPSLVPSYNDDDLIGTVATTADANFDNTHPLYQTYSDYAAIRDAHLALRQGAQLHRYSEASAGIYAFSRIERGEQIEYVVALNNAESADSATFQIASPDTTFSEIYPGDGPALASDAGGNLTVTVPGLDFVIYHADSPIPASTTAPGIIITTPEAGAEVTGRVEIAAEVNAEVLAEVTFAVSVDGGEYQVIGTDDNAPYRVFYDVSDLPAGTDLTFKAFVNDLASNLNADKVSVAVGA